MPPQFPTSTAAAGNGVKRPAFLPAAAAAPPRKIARPASVPCLPALSASAPKKIPPRPLLSPAPPSSAARPRPPPSSSSSAPVRTAGPKKPSAQRQAADAEAAPCRAAESVHPSRRLACGTAVIVRTRYILFEYRCCLLIWLPARVVSSSDAYHCTIKYAADLNPMYAGKIVRVPAAEVREAPSHRSSANAIKRPHLKAP
uniref:Uncharacterized protein n=1 Tax=Avena sativa TaxID=4498 RepID=A0ACD5WDX9_AVESA